MVRTKLIAAIVAASTLAIGQDVGIEGGKVIQVITAWAFTYGEDGTLPIEGEPPPPSNPGLAPYQLAQKTIPVPYPYTNKINISRPISKQEAINLGANPDEIEGLERSIAWELEKHGDGGESIDGLIEFSVEIYGSYVGKPRNTFAILCKPDDPGRNSNAWYASSVRGHLKKMGWSNTIYNTNPVFTDFTDTNCVINNSNSDIVFYFGHGFTGGYGPAVPGFDYNFHKMIDWGHSSGRQRGARWFMMQSCQWFRPEYDLTVSGKYPSKVLASDEQSRWGKAFSYGRGSLHGIFGYASNAASLSTTDIPKNVHNFNLTNLASVASIDSMKNGACIGAGWFQGPRTQTKYQYGGGPGYVPACVTICNRTCGDYFYETLGAMYPDPIDVPDDEATLVFHYEYFNSEYNGAPPSWD